MKSNMGNGSFTSIISLSGGIGSGKSVVSDILRSMGYCVYDSDSEAKRIMDSTPAICREISGKISPTAIDGSGAVNRKTLASIVFNDPEKLRILNSIVHLHVLEDIKVRAGEISRGERPEIRHRDIFFVESAITFTSGIYRLCSDNWLVTAPEDVRITRVMSRDGCTCDDALRRISSQRDESELIDRLRNDGTVKIYEIINNGSFHTPLLPQISDYFSMIYSTESDSR